MARAKTNKFYRTFSKGLITEAGYLTYPEDASSDELNTILSRKGNRSRRLGIDYEDGHLLNEIPEEENYATSEFVWHSVNNDPSVSFLCLQIGPSIHMFRMLDKSLSTSRNLYIIHVHQFKIPTASDEQFNTEYCDMSAGFGILFIAHKYMDPVSVEYDAATDTFKVVPIVIQVRDFEGVYDGLANDDEPYQLTAQHHYNLLNQGWVTPGTKTVNISGINYDSGNYTPSPGTDVGTGGSTYFDPYTGETTYPGNRNLSPDTQIQ